MAHILIFGDSISAGCWDEKGGWPERVKQHINKKVIASNLEWEHIVYNLGISGNNTQKVLKRFENEVTQRSEEEVIIIFAIGTNDSKLIHATNDHNIPVTEFKDNLKKLYSLGQKYSSKIMFVGLFGADDGRVDPIPWKPDTSYRQVNIEKYNTILKEFCQVNKIPFVEIMEKILQEDYKKLLCDGIHPTSEGHEKMFEIIYPELEKFL